MHGLSHISIVNGMDIALTKVIYDKYKLLHDRYTINHRHSLKLLSKVQHMTCVHIDQHN